MSPDGDGVKPAFKAITGLSIVSLILSLLTLAYWTGGKMTDVSSGFISVIYELLWLPMIVSLLFLPVFSIVFLLKDKPVIRSLYFYALIISVTDIILTIIIL